MKLLIVGDSITEGVTGVNYIDLLTRSHPELKVTNLGLGGDTLIGITNRLAEHIKENTDYDAIIIEAGHNDIILPYFEHGELPFKITARAIEARGSYPITDDEVFANQYDSLLKLVKKMVTIPVYITTLSCIGEDLNMFTNKKREHYNHIIRNLAVLHHLTLIDVALKFEAYLSFAMTNNYLMNDFFRAFVVDKSMSNQQLNHISAERGLHLTIDGVHLNEKGAEFYAEAIEDVLSLNKNL
jgi:lysophospholipase L1-like esterase